MRRVKASTWLLFVASLAAASAVACGEETKSAPTSSVTPMAGELTKGVCDLSFRCCSRGEINYLLGPYVRDDDCEDRLVTAATLATSKTIDLEDILGVRIEVPNVAALDRAAKDGRGNIDRAGLNACLAYLQELACNAPEEEEDPDGCVPPDPPPEPTPCDPENLFKGSVGLGGACSSGPDSGPLGWSGLGSLECLEGLVCRSNPDLGVFGQCVPAGLVGDPCFSSSECDDELYCSQLDGTCKEYRQEGESCVFANRDDLSPDPSTALLRCRADLSCDPITDTCVARCQQGAQCSSDADCDDEQDLVCIVGRCDRQRGEGLVCAGDADCLDTLRCEADPSDPERNICTPLAANGEECFLHSDCNSGFCDPTLDRCAAPLSPGAICRSGEDEQCRGGRCESSYIYCTTDTDCTGSNSCNLASNQCDPYCVELKPDGATCTLDSECFSDECIAGFCRTPPLALGQDCETASQCESEFCSYDDERVCKELPLPLGAPCSSDYQCDSEVCFDTSGFGGDETCISGLDEGEACGDYGQPPCNPKKFYCDTELESPVCTPLLETGIECLSSQQCRGQCVTAHGRRMCNAAPPPNGAVCDGSDE